MNQIEKEIHEVLERHNAKIVIRTERLPGPINEPIQIGIKIEFEKVNKE